MTCVSDRSAAGGTVQPLGTYLSSTLVIIIYNIIIIHVHVYIMCVQLHVNVKINYT